LCKDVMVKSGRYNQHIGVYSLLLEVGNNKNTLEEALNAMPALAQALEGLMISQPDEHLAQLRTAAGF